MFCVKARDFNPPAKFRLRFKRAAEPGENGGEPVSLIDTTGSLQYIGPNPTIDAEVGEFIDKHRDWTGERCAKHLGIPVKKFARLAKATGWRKPYSDGEGINVRGGPKQERRWVKDLDAFAVESQCVGAANVR